MRRQIVAGVCFLLVGFAGVIFGRAGSGAGATLGSTVPAEVLTDRMTAVDVMAVARDELAVVGRQFRLPPHTLALVDRFGSAGNTVIAGEPVQYTVVLWTMYYSEGQLRKTVAHEAGHMLLGAAGLKQSEESADLVALCFGSRLAREYAAEYGRVRQGDCAGLGRLLRGDGE